MSNSDNIIEELQSGRHVGFNNSTRMNEVGHNDDVHQSGNEEILKPDLDQLMYYPNIRRSSRRTAGVPPSLVCYDSAYVLKAMESNLNIP